MTLQPWKIKQSRYVLKDRWITIRSDTCETADGRIIGPYYVEEPSDWVHVVAFDDQDRILVTRQYRHGLGEVCTEIPCGALEIGEVPVVGMQRELLEETGCSAESFHELPSFSPNPARYANRIHPFFAMGVRQIQKPHLDENEEIEFEFLSVSQVLELVDSGDFQQPLHIATLFATLRKRGFIVQKGI
jgi:8-oxo-dGTP pyrophosphatase MutT (NUDIX family)